MFASLGVNDQPREKSGDNQCYNIEHYDADEEDDNMDEEDEMQQYYFVDDEEYRCTGAHVRFGINQRGGSESLRLISGFDLHINIPVPRPPSRLKLSHDMLTSQSDYWPELRKS